MSEFTQSLHEVFTLFGPLTIKKMFGGYGVYKDGLMFGLVADDELYLKVDKLSVDTFADEGSVPFQYDKNGKSVKMSYYSAPEEIFDDPESATTWATRAFEAALRGRK